MKKAGFVYRFVFVALCLAFLLGFTGCGGGSSLDGVWIVKTESGEASLVFSGNRCFIIENNYIEGTAEYSFEKGSGAFKMSGELVTFTVKGNKLDMDVGRQKHTLSKDTATKTPFALNGLWKGDKGWAFAFFGDKVYMVDDDEDGIMGTYRFDKNKGSIKSDWYDFEFAIVGKDMVVTGDQELTLKKSTK